MPYATSGSLTTDKRTTSSSTGWDTQSEWEANQSNTNVEITNGTIRLTDAQFQIPDSAIHQWRFSEGSGTTTADAVGNADGTLTTDTMWTSGTWIGDNALVGDGSDDIVETTMLGSFGSSMDTDFSLSASVNTSVDVSSNQHFIDVIGSGNSTSLLFGFVNGGNIRFFVRDEGSNIIEVRTDSSFDDGVNHRVVCVKTGNAASDLSIFVDGSEVSVSISTDESFGNVADFDTNVGLLGRVGGGNEFGGTLDEPMIFDAALSSQEITDDYNRQPWS